jgi:hypothetical protein
MKQVPRGVLGAKPHLWRERTIHRDEHVRASKATAIVASSACQCKSNLIRAAAVVRH